MTIRVATDVVPDPEWRSSLFQGTVRSVGVGKSKDTQLTNRRSPARTLHTLGMFYFSLFIGVFLRPSLKGGDEEALSREVARPEVAQAERF